MKDMGLVNGSAEQARPLVIGKDTVYVHTDITPAEDGGYCYHEIQYEKDEYIHMLADELVNVQLALCDIYEGAV